MIRRTLATALLLAVLAPAAAHAARTFTAHADLQPTGCTQTLAGTAVRLRGCTADARAGGTVPGRLTLAYEADVDIARGSGEQRGTLTLTSTSGKDKLVARFRGTVTISGSSRGTWTALHRKGAFAKLAASGSYTSSSPDRGVHIAIDVRG